MADYLNYRYDGHFEMEGVPSRVVFAGSEERFVAKYGDNSFPLAGVSEGDFFVYLEQDMQYQEIYEGLIVYRRSDLKPLLKDFKISEISELEGIAWEGWTSLLEAEGMTKEDFIPIIVAGFISEGVEEVTQRQALQHTIHGCEAVEVQIACKIEGEPGIVNLLLVFAENDLGVVVMLGEESACEKYEDTWHEIRDSVQF